MCGRDTFYLWDFQTDDNPDGKMPVCLGNKPLVITALQKTTDALKLTVHFLLTGNNNCQLLYLRNQRRKKASGVVYCILQGLRMRYNRKIRGCTQKRP